MPPYVSADDDLVLHGPRVLGFASPSRIGARFRLDTALVEELLLDHEARGWVSATSFAGSSGWSITEKGRTENERRLSIELDRAGAREVVTDAHADFLPLNRRFGIACTNWQIRPTRADPMAFNDHTDWAWDERVLRTLAALDKAFRGVCDRLAERLQRFDGYSDRYSAALAKVEAGQKRWVDAPDIDACHTVWIQFHEDLLATLGIPRGADT
ncbi:hypothetical protein [Spirillospora albida]|uniref:hypothetical protein n=1 Tax=Spirillospora albida TaxID=58123 RepID=UPI0004C05B51|nr:hypothetical protein [Spirillospora albida]